METNFLAAAATITILTYFIVSEIGANLCDIDIYATNLVEQGHRLEDSVIHESKAKHVVECAQLCIRRGQCQSFNYINDDTNLCQLNRQSGNPTVAGADSYYSNIADWPPQTDPDCFNNTCGEDEICVPGLLSGGQTCSHTCFKLARRCPVPRGTNNNQSRTVGSVFNHTCGDGLVGLYVAKCLESGDWNETIDNVCAPLFNSSCSSNVDCSGINGNCTNGTCSCQPGYIYESSKLECTKALFNSSCSSNVDCSGINGNCTNDCDAGWERIKDRCYYFSRNSSEVSNYDNAQKFCSARESKLVETETEEEHKSVKAFITNTTESIWNFWLGLRRKNDNTFGWESSNRAPTFSGWASGNQGQTTVECVFYNGTWEHSWWKVKCTDHAAPLCEKARLTFENDAN